VTASVRIEATLTLRDLERPLELGESSALGSRVEVLHPRPYLIGGGDYVVLVHGYNTSHEEARESYARFRWWLGYFNVRARILELHWPGDRKWGRLSAFCYPMRIGTAIASGARLADWISSCHAEARFTLVAHSLGCRLVMEAVERLRAINSTNRLVGVCLMAAAVPVRAVTMRSLGPRSGELRTRWQVLFSRSDNVLKDFFRTGQAAGRDYIGSKAVGLTGEPAEIWNSAGTTLEMEQDSIASTQRGYYDHGHYWQGGPVTRDNEVRRDWRQALYAIEAPEENRGYSALAFAGLLRTPTTRIQPILPLPPARKHLVRRLP
jgi:pimeloyl-ACP methyl ester carboxylesterase